MIWALPVKRPRCSKPLSSKLNFRLIGRRRRRCFSPESALGFLLDLLQWSGGRVSSKLKMQWATGKRETLVSVPSKLLFEIGRHKPRCVPSCRSIRGACLYVRQVHENTKCACLVYSIYRLQMGGAAASC